MSVFARFTISGTAILTALLGASCMTEPPVDETVQSVINHPLPSNLNLALNARTTVTIGPFTEVDGDIASTGANGSVLFDVSSSQGFFFGNFNVLANTVTVRTQARANNIFGNDIVVDGSATNRFLGLDPSALPAVPAVTPVSAGTRAVSVAANQSKQLCPGQYGAISIASGGTLNLNGGVYQVSRLTLADGAHLEPSEPVVIVVTGSMTTGSNAEIEPSPQSINPMFAQNIRIEVAGTITLGTGSNVHAHLLTAGKLTADNGVRLTGAAWARSIALGSNGLVRGEGVFAAQAPEVPPPCNDNSACTTDACVTSGTLAFCRNTPVAAGTSCDDSDICNGADVCGATGVCEHSDALPAGTSCSDGNACNGIELCGTSATCTPGTPPVIPGGGVCTLTTCGDGIVDPGEQCDDGNIDDLDGCSNLCTLQVAEIEPNDDGNVSVSFSFFGNDFFAPAADANGAFSDSVIIRASLSPAGDEDVFAFENTGSTARAVQFDVWNGQQGIGVPCFIDPVLAIRTSDGSILASSDQVNGGCPALQFTIQPGQRVYAQVLDFLDDTLTPDYLLVATYR